MTDLMDDLDFSDDQMYANYDAFKTLTDAGVSRAEALKRTGLTEQIVKDFELEEEENEFKDEFKEEWDKFDGGDDDEFGSSEYDGFNEFGDDEDEYGSGSDSNDFGGDDYE